jgi:methanogen homocitrate synthase
MIKEFGSMEEKMYWMSPYNELEGKGRTLKLYDTTLRDGEQTLGVAFTAEQKLEIALLLDELGVDRIEAGMPVVSPEDKRAVEMIVNRVKRAEVWGFCRGVIKDIDACLEAGVRSTIIEIPLSKYKWRAYGYNEERVFNMLNTTLRYAKQSGMYVAYFAVDATRAELPVLERAYKTAVNECGVDEIVMVDTLGVATPKTMAYLTKLVKEFVKVPVMVHCHNDFGLGVACTLASLLAGAECAHITVNGMGEKTGNADLAEVALAADLLYGFKVNIDYARLYPLSKKVAELSGIPVGLQKPVVGDGIFTKETGVTVTQLLTYPPAVETYAPELVGRKRAVALSKKSGKGSLRWVLQEMGEDLDDARLDELLVEVKKLGVHKKGILTQEEFAGLLSKYK